MASILVYPYLSPRIIEVLAPDTTITIQELINLIRDWEDSEEGELFEFLISASGKESLGGGISVGITAELNNAQIMFSARSTPRDDGTGRTCDATDTLGRQLFVNDATFISNGVVRGDIVYNKTTGSSASVLEVVSETTINHLQLSGGTGTQWTATDEYIVFQMQQCNILGGNLVAIDDVGAELTPVFTSFGTQVVRAASSSATLVSGGGGTAIADKVYVDTEALVNGDGSPGSPFDNIGDAIDYAEANSIKQIVVYAEVTLDRNLKNFVIIGIGAPVINCNGQDLNKSEFSHCTMRGTYTGIIVVQESVLDNGFSLNGFFEKNAFNGDLTCLDGSYVLLANCFSNIPGLARPTISLNGIGTSTLSIRNYSGGLTIKDVNNVADVVTVEMSQGKLTLDTTCTAGLISVRGISQFTDNSNGTIVDTSGLLDTEINLLSELEMKQLRDALGIDGDKSVAKGGQLQKKSEYPNNSTIDTQTINPEDL